MPIWLRRFTYKQIQETKQAESDANSKSAKGKGNIDMNSPNKAKIPKQAFSPPTSKAFNSANSSPSYTTRASKK
jgi:hypothetical protein|tara:strand:- start:157 stop:378 length:222 start_codon:yes stop_codon:yes gene_type:complete